MNDPLTMVGTRRTRQSEPDPAVAPRQKRNAAGGYTFKISDEALIHRFLTIGTTGGTYYTGEAELTKASAEVVLAAARDRGQWLVEKAFEVSIAGRAPKQNPAIFALAAVAGLGDEAARKAAFENLPLICRTGSTLFLFARYVEQFRGWGRGLRNAVGRWYLSKPVDDVAYQAVKYRQREGWTHADLLRLAHPEPDAEDTARRELFRWIVDGELGPHTPALVSAFAAVQRPDVSRDVLFALIAQRPLSWEMLPDATRTPEVWAALVRKGMPQGALLRQLPTLTRLDVFDPRPQLVDIVCEQLVDPVRLRKARVHPINVLVALRTYASGHSVRGESTWVPNRRIIDALDEAFYAAFGAVEPANKRTLIALDVSGSMGNAASGLPLTCREGAAALAMVTMATEPSCDVVGFTGSNSGWGAVTYSGGRNEWTPPASHRRSSYGTTTISELSISPRQRLDDAIRSVSNLPFGATDCALPMLWATAKGRDYDTIIVITDNETWSGDVHPHQALREYRERVGHDVRQIVIGMTATDCSIADPADPSTLDVAGFDSAVPNLVADFSRGTV